MMKTRMISAVVAMTLFTAGCGKQEDSAAASAETASTATAPDAPATREEPATATAAASAAAATAIAAQDTPVASVATGAGSNAELSAVSAAPPGAMPAPSPVSAQSTPPAAVSSPAVTSKPVSAPSTTTQTTTLAPAKATTPPAPATAAGTVIESSSTVTLNGDHGSLVRADTLRARNAADAPEIAALAAGTAVKILARDGAWYQINVNGKTGWVRMMSVRRSEAASNDVAGLAGIASGRTGTGKVVATTGVRGLDSGDLTAATFDEARIAKAESLRVSRSDAEAFARQGGLVTQNVPALPAPAK